MIDTIVLLVPEHEFTITNHDAFTPSTKQFFSPPFYKGNMRCVQNPKIKEKADYKPRLTLSKKYLNGNPSLMLKIEFSAPKLIFGNNFQELEDSYFDLVLMTLHQKLHEMCVEVSVEALRHADVVGIHYSKNIPITTAPTSLVLDMLRRIDVSQHLDSGDTDFRNGGQAIRFHNNSYEIAFYDKVKDLQQSKISDKRAFENDNIMQIELLDVCKSTNAQILRMEVRLNKKQKIREMLQTLNLPVEQMKFESLFSKEIARYMLSYFWHKCVTPSQHTLMLCEEEPITIFHKMRFEGCKDGDILKAIGALTLHKEEGARKLKVLLGKSNNIYSKLQNQLNGVAIHNQYLRNIFNNTRQALVAMESLTDLSTLK